jgi:predicted transcriptional regulator
MALEHQVMVRFDSELFAKALELAQAEDRPPSYFIRRAVKEDVARRSKGSSKFGGGVNRQAVRAMVKSKQSSEVSPNFKKGGKK